MLALIDHFSAGFQNPGAAKIFFRNFMKFWGEHNYLARDYLPVKTFALKLKTFGVNLANYIRRQPEAEAYFRKYPKAEKQLVELLAKLTKALKKLEEIK